MVQRADVILATLALLPWQPELVLDAWVVLLEENLARKGTVRPRSRPGSQGKGPDELIAHPAPGTLLACEFAFY